MVVAAADDSRAVARAAKPRQARAKKSNSNTTSTLSTPAWTQARSTRSSSVRWTASRRASRAWISTTRRVKRRDVKCNSPWRVDPRLMTRIIITNSSVCANSDCSNSSHHVNAWTRAWDRRSSLSPRRSQSTDPRTANQPKTTTTTPRSTTAQAT